jgi:hypothetical protein
MDIIQLHSMTNALGTIGFLLPILASIAAGLATFALLAGVSKMHRKSLPPGFPRDAEAALPKYDMAFRQLEETYQQHIQEDGQLPWSGTMRPSLVLSDGAFATFKKPASVQRKPVSVMSHPTHSKETKSKDSKGTEKKESKSKETKEKASNPKDSKSKNQKKR